MDTKTFKGVIKSPSELIREAVKSTDDIGVGYTGSSTISSGYVFAPYIPLIRQSVPTLTAQQFVSVQPMSQPTGLIFNIRPGNVIVSSSIITP